MNNSLFQSAIYFMNVILHIGVFWVLFTVAIPEHLTIQEQIIDFWSHPEGKEVILLNLSFLVGNLIFAFTIISKFNKSLFSSILIVILSWTLALAIYSFGANGLLYSYILGAIMLTYFAVGKYNANKNA